MSSDPTSHQTINQTSGLSSCSAWILTPQSASALGLVQAVGLFLRSTYLSLQTPCKYLRNSAKCPEYAGISCRALGAGRAVRAGAEPLPCPEPRPAAARSQRRQTRASPRGPCPPVGGQRERGIGQGQRQQSGRSCAPVAGRSGGAAARAAGEGSPGPLRPREAAVLARDRPAPSVPLQGRAAAGQEQELCLPRPAGVRGLEPPGEPHRGSGAVRAVPAPGPALARLQLSRPARKVLPGRAGLYRAVCPWACPHRYRF